MLVEISEQSFQSLVDFAHAAAGKREDLDGDQIIVGSRKPDNKGPTFIRLETLREIQTLGEPSWKP